MTNEEKAKEIANDFYIHGARTYLARVEAAQRMADWKDEQIKIEKQAAIDKNELLVIRCIMALNKYDLRSAVKFAENVPDLYELAMAVAQAKDEEYKANKG